MKSAAPKARERWLRGGEGMKGVEEWRGGGVEDKGGRALRFTVVVFRAGVRRGVAVGARSPRPPSVADLLRPRAAARSACASSPRAPCGCRGSAAPALRQHHLQRGESTGSPQEPTKIEESDARTATDDARQMTRSTRPHTPDASTRVSAAAPLAASPTTERPLLPPLLPPPVEPPPYRRGPAAAPYSNSWPRGGFLRLSRSTRRFDKYPAIRIRNVVAFSVRF